jgi:L-seryl-tRNA(Ser) seleniumtransferase
MRAFRVEKLILAALEATLAAYRDGPEKAIEEIPTLAMIRATEDGLGHRARNVARSIAAALGEVAEVRVIAGSSEAGGGSLPDEPMPTALVAVRPLKMSADALVGALRRTEPPVIAFIREDTVLFDLRTVLPAEERELHRLVAEAIGLVSRA